MWGIILMTYIYSLSDPITNEIRYVGKTKHLLNRYRNHCYSYRDKKSHKRSWIESLKTKGLKPLLETLDIVDDKDWIFWEQYWIWQCKTWGFNLVNHTMGGEQGPSMKNKTSFKKGNKPWNKGTAHKQRCKICGKTFKAPKSANRKYCSIKCTKINNSKNPNKSTFKKNLIPWNKNKLGYNTSKAKPVQQFTLNNVFIKEYRSCKEASQQMGLKDAESIRRCIIGKAKTAANFKWKYKNE